MLIAAAFSMFNRYVDGLATFTPVDDDALRPDGPAHGVRRLRPQMSSYLPGVVADAKPGTYKTLVDGADAAGVEYSKIWDLFAFQPETNEHLAASATACCASRRPSAPGCAS